MPNEAGTTFVLRLADRQLEISHEMIGKATCDKIFIACRTKGQMLVTAEDLASQSTGHWSRGKNERRDSCVALEPLYKLNTTWYGFWNYVI